MQRLLAIASSTLVAAVHATAAAAAGHPCDTVPMRNVRIDAPLAITPWARVEKAAARDAIEAEFRGKPYSAEAGNAVLARLNGYGFAALASDAQVDCRYFKLTVDCPEGAADLGIYVFAPRSSPRVKLGASGTTVHAAGGVEYDRAEHLSAVAGGDARLSGDTSLSLDARKSASADLVAVALSGGFGSGNRPLAQADWRIDYLRRLDPMRTVGLRQERVAAAGSVSTQPLGTAGIPVVAGGSVEAGRYSSDADADDAVDATGRSRYRAAKLFVAAGGRVDRTSWNLAYGVERGDLARSSGARWTRQVVDATLDSAPALGALRASIEARLTGGDLRRDADAPIGVRFIGGGRERLLVPGDPRSPREAPLFRGLGSGELPAASRFAALNLTLGVPVYRKPVIPAELASDEEFRSQLTGGLESAVSQRQTTYSADDPHFATAVDLLPNVRTALKDLKAQVLSGQAAGPAGSEAAVKACVRAIDVADRRARQALEGKTGGARFGFLVELLPPGRWAETPDDLLGTVHVRCGDELGARVSSTAVAAGVATVDAAAGSVALEMGAIDFDRAGRKARAELAPASDVLARILSDFDLLAVSPLLMIDAVRLDDGRLRRGIGAGLRVALVSTVELDLGYMANRHRGPGESSGAFFMMLRVKDFF